MIAKGFWLKMLLKDFGYDVGIVIYEDNQRVMRIAEDNNSNKRLKLHT